MTKDIEVYQCPVLLLTPSVRTLLQWFDLLYVLEVSAGWPQYRRTALPCDGGLSAQPAKLLESLAWVASQRNTALWRRATAATAEARRSRSSRSRR